MAEVWEHPFLEDSTEKLVMLCLADFANDEGECWPKIPTIARKCAITEGACSNIIKRLETKSFLSVTRRRGRGNFSTYLLHPAKGRKADKKRRVVAPSPDDFQTDDFPAEDDAPAEGNDTKPIPEKGFNDGDLEENPIQKRVFQNTKPVPEKGFLNEPYKEEPSVFKPPVEPSGRETRESGRPLSPENRRRAFVEGEADSRFQTPHYLAVCRACDRGPEGITWKMRVKLAGAAIELESQGYTVEDIDLVASRWPHAVAPNPEQLQNDFRPLLNQRMPPSERGSVLSQHKAELSRMRAARSQEVSN